MAGGGSSASRATASTARVGCQRSSTRQASATTSASAAVASHATGVSSAVHNASRVVVEDTMPAEVGPVREHVDDRLRIALPIALAGTVAALAVAEQQCCPFFEFTLRLADPEVELEVRAPGQAATLLAAVLADAD